MNSMTKAKLSIFGALIFLGVPGISHAATDPLVEKYSHLVAKLYGKVTSAEYQTLTAVRDRIDANGESGSKPNERVTCSTESFPIDEDHPNHRYWSVVDSNGKDWGAMCWSASPDCESITDSMNACKAQNQ